MTTVPPVTFNFTTWTTMFPEFAGLSSTQGQAYFDLATLYCANSTCNPAFGDGTLSTLLYLMTSHVAWLNAPRDGTGMPAQTGQPASPLVGRISSTTEGSVSVSTENSYAPGTPQWYQQTRYGAQYWAATAGYRTMRYAARPTFVPSGIYTGRRGVW